eukprot:gene7723-9920_t
MLQKNARWNSSFEVSLPAACHRLDRLTSGVLILAKTKAAAKRIEKAMKSHSVVKEYVCRVRGKFPESLINVLKTFTRLYPHPSMLGLCNVAAEGKPCRTEFSRTWYHKSLNVSVVRYIKALYRLPNVNLLCTCSHGNSVHTGWPYTGRMHQIRVHLKYLGHPIENDPLYSTATWGPNKSVESVMALLEPIQEKSAPPTEAQAQIVRGCADCKVNYSDPSPADMVLYLHALSIQVHGALYKTQLPAWAQQPSFPILDKLAGSLGRASTLAWLADKC